MGYQRLYMARLTGRMPTRRTIAQAAGDPFLGGLIGGAARLLIPGAGKVVKAVGGLFKGKPKVVAPAVPAIVRGAKEIGKAAAVGGAVAAGSHLVGKMLGGGDRKRPSMNVTNVKALRRACRRVEGFSKLAKRTMSFTATHRLRKRKKRVC